MWPVIPICDAQKLDVNPADLLQGGLYRKCNTYKGGGGYDKFPEIFNKRFGTNRADLNNQFVVQLRGCPLHCPYCYVTRDGIDSTPVWCSTEKLVHDFHESGCAVFHLMGGAPALYINRWDTIIQQLKPGEVFHSDLLLHESYYKPATTERLSRFQNTLYAVSIKGWPGPKFEERTLTPFNLEKFEYNLKLLRISGLPHYFTFTGMDEEEVQAFKEAHPDHNYDDCIVIPVRHYDALDYKKE